MGESSCLGCMTAEGGEWQKAELLLTQSESDHTLPTTPIAKIPLPYGEGHASAHLENSVIRDFRRGEGGLSK